MANEADVHDYLNRLLITERDSLLFLYKNIHGDREPESLEQGVVDLVRRIRNQRGSLHRTVEHWLTSLGSLQPMRFQRCVVRVAGFYEDPRVASLLQGILRQLSFVSVHPDAVKALAQTLGIRAGKVLTDILWATPQQQWHLRETAILRELGEMGWSSSVPHLVKALSVPFDTPVRTAAVALSRFEAEEVLPLLLPLLENPRDIRPCSGAAEALGLLGDERAVVALQRLTRVDTAPRVVCAAAVALARLGEVDSERILVPLASHDRGHTGAEERARAVEALGLLESKDRKVSPDVLRVLTTCLQDSQPEVRSAAARSLCAVGGAGAARHVAKALQGEASPLVRSALIHALGRLGNKTCLPILLDFLNRDSPGVKVEVLRALSHFADPSLAQHISAHRRSSNPQVVEAANRALRLLLHKPFSWPDAAPLEEGGARKTVDLFEVESARRLLLPPPPPPPAPGFFDRLFGASRAAPAAPEYTPTGKLHLDDRGATLERRGEDPVRIAWARRFSLHVTREPIAERSSSEHDDIGVHFVLRQRDAAGSPKFETIAVSLWCAPSEAVARLTPKGARFPCLDPHNSDPFLSALRYYLEVHGEPLPCVDA